MMLLLRYPFIFFFFLLFFFINLSYVDAEVKPIRIISPLPDSENITKKPEVKVEFDKTIVKETIIVLFDGQDVTQLISFNKKGFEFKPFMVVPPGAHTLSITAKDKEGREIEETVSFITKHSKTFDEAWSNNNITIAYQEVLKKPESLGNLPDSKIENNLTCENKLKNQTWEVNFSTNIRHFDQNEPLMPPQKKGFDIINWIFTGQYIRDLFKAKLSLGDIQIEETPYILSGLSRKEGSLNFEYDTFQLNTFTVKSESFLEQEVE